MSDEQVEITDKETSKVLTFEGEDVSGSIDFQNNEVMVGMDSRVYEELEQKVISEKVKQEQIDRVIIESESVEGTHDLAEFIKNHEDLAMSME